jgi:hypothetical protein
MKIDPSVLEATLSSLKLEDKIKTKFMSGIQFFYQGKDEFQFSITTKVEVESNIWLREIEKQQQENNRPVYETYIISQVEDPVSLEISCSFVAGNMVLLGTKQGIYVGEVNDDRVSEQLIETKNTYRSILRLNEVHQLHVIGEQDCLLVLFGPERILQAFPLSSLLNFSDRSISRGRRIWQNVTFFKVGTAGDGKPLLCAAKTTPTSSNINVYEPRLTMPSDRNSFSLHMRGKGPEQNFKLLAELYIPSEAFSLSFLRRKVCVGCTKGFEVIDLDSLASRSLLDFKDTALDFVVG